MRKILLGLALLILMVSNSWATVGWNKSIPATSENPQAISPDVIENNTALDLMLQNYRDGYVTITLSSTSLITIGSGGVMLSNSGGSTRLMVANSSTSSLAPTNIDTGSISASSTYYIYAYASSTTATTFSVIFSASSSAPTGITYYQQIGSFTTDGSKNFINAVSNIGNYSAYNYGTGTSVGTQSTGSLKIAYGVISTNNISGVAITNLPFTSSSSYYAVASGQSLSVSGSCQASIDTASQITVFASTSSGTCNWIAIGT